MLEEKIPKRGAVDIRLEMIEMRLEECDEASIMVLLEKDLPWLIKALRAHRKPLRHLLLKAGSPTPHGYCEIATVHKDVVGGMRVLFKKKKSKKKPEKEEG